MRQELLLPAFPDHTLYLTMPSYSEDRYFEVISASCASPTARSGKEKRTWHAPSFVRCKRSVGRNGWIVVLLLLSFNKSCQYPVGIIEIL